VLISERAVILCAAVIGLADLLIWRAHPSYGVSALLDEPAHAATGLLAVAALGVSLTPAMLAAVLTGSVLIDADHVPAVLGSSFLQHGVPRPYTHSLGVIVIVVVVALAIRDRRRGQLLVVVALTLGLHFVRDMAEPGSPGVALAWPLSDHGFTFPYWLYAAGVLASAAVALLRRRGRRKAVPRDSAPMPLT
jgi:hypothetical protein